MSLINKNVVGANTCTSFKYSKITKQVKIALLTVMSVGALSHQAAYSQEQNANSAEVKQAESNITEATKKDEIEVIEVTGMRFSNRKAINRKKTGGTMLDSLVAEDIGEFPDKNVGEALQRIPGIQLERDFGEGNSISIRGVESSLVRVEVNNVSSLGMGGGRSVDFRDMASELITSLDVIKGTEARLTEGGVGGTVQVNTRKPNEFDENFLSVSAEGQYNTLSEKTNPKFNVTGVYKATENLGILANITISDKKNRIHALRNTEWARFSDYDNTAEKTVVDEDYASITNKTDCASTADQATCEEQWWDFSPRLPRYGIWQRDESRISANTMVQYQLTDNLSTHVNYTYNERDKDSTDYNLHLETPSAARVDADSVVVDENHNVTYFESAAATVTNRTLNYNWNQKTSLFDTGFEYSTDNWDIEGILSHSTAKENIDSRDTHITANGVAGVQVTLDDRGAPEWDFNTGYFVNSEDATDTSDSFDVNDPASYRSRSRYKYSPSNSESSETMAKIDATYTLDYDFFTNVRTGVQFTQYNTETASYQHNIIRDVGTEYNGEEWTLADQVALITGNTHESPELFHDYSLGINTIGSYQAVSTQGFIDSIQAVTDDNTTIEDLDVRTGNWDIDLETKAIYLQSDFFTEIAGMEFWGNIGIRYVETDTLSNGDVTVVVIVDQVDENGDVLVDPDTGFDLEGIEDTDHESAYDGRKTIKENYSDVLPSINMSLGLTEELVLYFGAGKVMARPKNTYLNVNASCTIYETRQSVTDGTANSCSAGNPDLDPYRATQMDLALSWYPNQDSIVSGAYFTKKITSWIIDANTRYDVDFFNDGRLWDVKQRTNGSGVTTSGIELQASTAFTMLPEPFDGLGGSVNYTYMTADNVGLFNQLTGEELAFPSQSENSYNISGFWENENYKIRVAYNYRDEYLASAADRSGNPVYVADAGYLDAKFTYSPDDSNFKFYIDGKNLLSEVKLEHAGDHRLSNLQWSGREFSMGFSYHM